MSGDNVDWLSLPLLVGNIVAAAAIISLLFALFESIEPSKFFPRYEAVHSWRLFYFHSIAGQRKSEADQKYVLQYAKHKLILTYFLKSLPQINISKTFAGI